MAYYLVTNRQFSGNQWQSTLQPSGGVTFFKHNDGDSFDPAAHLNGSGLQPSDFTRVPVSRQKAECAAITARAVAIQQQHPMIVVFIHGYNNDDVSALHRSLNIYSELQKRGLSAVHVCFDWPSEGKLTGYLQDRDNARLSYPALLNAIAMLEENGDPINCPANVCVIAHSMGNLVLREALSHFSPQVGSPEHLPLFAETVMAGADVDNDTLQTGNSGDAICAFSRRVTVYYNHFDQVLLVSQTAKNGGAARLGRTGPADFSTLDPKVLAVDCSEAIKPSGGNPLTVAYSGLSQIHSAYFDSPQFYDDLHWTLMSIDRNQIPTRSAKQPFAEDSFVLNP